MMIDQKRLDAAFEAWWRHEGSAPPEAGVDWEEHCRNLAAVAWDNGAFAAQRLAPDHTDLLRKAVASLECMCAWHADSPKEARCSETIAEIKQALGETE